MAQYALNSAEILVGKTDKFPRTTPAPQRFWGVTAFVEKTLLEAPAEQFLSLRRLSRFVHNVISGSPALQKKLFLRQRPHPTPAENERLHPKRYRPNPLIFLSSREGRAFRLPDDPNTIYTARTTRNNPERLARTIHAGHGIDSSLVRGQSPLPRSHNLFLDREEVSADKAGKIPFFPAAHLDMKLVDLSVTIIRFYDFTHDTAPSGEYGKTVTRRTVRMRVPPGGTIKDVLEWVEKWRGADCEPSTTHAGIASNFHMHRYEDMRISDRCPEFRWDGNMYGGPPDAGT